MSPISGEARPLSHRVDVGYEEIPEMFGAADGWATFVRTSLSAASAIPRVTTLYMLRGGPSIRDHRGLCFRPGKFAPFPPSGSLQELKR